MQNPPEGELEQLPAAVSSLSARVLDAQGVYLMENGVTSILHFGPEVPSVMIEALLGGIPASLRPSRGCLGFRVKAVRQNALAAREFCLGSFQQAARLSLAENLTVEALQP